MLFTAVSTCVFLALFGFFSKTGALNIFLKLGMLGLGIWGLTEWL